jgi:acetate kinase
LSLVLVLNGGSSSLKFALFRTGGEALERQAVGRIDMRPGSDAAAALEQVAQAIAGHARLETIDAAGHRIVHGGATYSAPTRITPAVIDTLRALAPFDPEHLPAEIALIEALARRAPGAVQVACFDTAFHAGLPRVARLLPIPRRYEALGVRRYGFHGLSYASLLDRLRREGRPGEVAGRVVLAHLGNGASLAAVHGGAPVDTTMAFTPAAGVPMGRRSGDLDPGLIAWLARTEGMTIEVFNRMVHEESGLFGISGTSGDVRELMAREAADPRAREALDLFCYEVRKRIGAFAAALGGLDTLIFSGGIGENAPAIRQRIAAGLEFLGVRLDPERNAAGRAGSDGVGDRFPAVVISAAGAPVTVRVIATDEEGEIARSVARLLVSA